MKVIFAAMSKLLHLNFFIYECSFAMVVWVFARLGDSYIAKTSEELPLPVEK